MGVKIDGAGAGSKGSILNVFSDVLCKNAISSEVVLKVTCYISALASSLPDTCSRELHNLSTCIFYSTRVTIAMDLLSSIRKSGSRGGVDFKWEDVSNSVHRENYLGHSLMAPVGRWQKGKDLNWYAKGDEKDSATGETAEEKRIRERKEEIKRIKEAEEDALAKALGLPVAPRNNGPGSGANNIDIGEMKKMVKEGMEDEDVNDETEQAGRGVGFGAFVGAGAADTTILARANDMPSFDPEQGGLVGKDRKESKKSRRERSRSRERHHRRHRHRSRSHEGRRHRERHGDDDTRGRRHRSRSVERKDARYRDHSEPREGRSRRDERERRRSPDRRSRRSRSPDRRDRWRDRDGDYRRR